VPQIVLGPSQAGALDASVKKQAYAFLEKLAADDTTPGLHIEPINNCADSRVRTGRVNDFYRAILFKVQGHAATAHYVYLGVLAHDDAIAFARKVRLTVNPVNGIAEIIVATQDTPDEPTALAAPAPSDVAPVATGPAPLLPMLGIDEKALVEELGLEAGLARVALEVTTEDEILALADGAVQWQGLALIDLASGTPLSDVQAALGVDTDAHPAADEGEDEALIVALQHPAAQMQFAFIEDNDELRRAIEDEDFAAWRVFLHPEQRRYATATYTGPFRLSGGAGTGKTVVLLHRARYLARQNPSARILLTTFTKNLAQAMKADLRRLDPSLVLASSLGEPGIYVCGIDAAVSSVLKTYKGDLAIDLETVLGPRSSEISGRTPEALWQEAAATVGDALPLNTRWSSCPPRSLHGTTISPCADPDAALPSTARSDSPFGRLSTHTEPDLRSKEPSTSRKLRPWPPLRSNDEPAPAAPSITSSSTRGRTSTPATGGSFALSRPTAATTCSWPRTPTSGSTANELS